LQIENCWHKLSSRPNEHLIIVWGISDEDGEDGAWGFAFNTGDFVDTSGIEKVEITDL
jgi:hypothetical protein